MNPKQLKKALVRKQMKARMRSLRFDERLLEVNEAKTVLAIFGSMAAAWENLKPDEINSILNQTGDYEAITEKWMNAANKPFSKDIKIILEEVKEIALSVVVNIGEFINKTEASIEEIAETLAFEIKRRLEGEGIYV